MTKRKKFAVELINENIESLQEINTVELLKKLEQIGVNAFKSDAYFESERQVLGTDKKSQDIVQEAVIYSDFKEVEEYSSDFYKLYDVAASFQKFVRQMMREALNHQKIKHGFEDFDKIFIEGALDVQDHYDDYYIEWMKAVHNTPAAQKIRKMQKDNPVKLKKIIDKKDLDNHYTIISLNKKKKFTQEAYIDYFEDTLGKLISTMNTWIGKLRTVAGLTDKQQRYTEYLSHYVQCLSEDSVDILEQVWSELDRMWVDVTYPLQIVHDIEYGYGDPLRAKVIPDFSLRFLDSKYSEENKTLDEIRDVLIDFYKPRDTELGKKGVKALTNSFAGIYYVPARTGMSLHFRFAGQSIPNRTEIRAQKGIKIYFDPVSWGQRIEKVKNHVRKLFKDKSHADRLNAVDSIVQNVAAHEYGHAIYGLEAIKEISSETKSLLEEPRAELTSVTTLLLLYEKELLSTQELKDALFSFAASDLKRFANYKSKALLPYIISARNVYKVYEDTGYLQVKDDKLVLDEEKASQVLDILSSQFEEILEAEDNNDGDRLRGLLEQMKEESDIVRWLVDKLN
jgi:hypothetical protein